MLKRKLDDSQDGDIEQISPAIPMFLVNPQRRIVKVKAQSCDVERPFNLNQVDPARRIECLAEWNAVMQFEAPHWHSYALEFAAKWKTLDFLALLIDGRIDLAARAHEAALLFKNTDVANWLAQNYQTDHRNKSDTLRF